jgi:hypothetical protein
MMREVYGVENMGGPSLQILESVITGMYAVPDVDPIRYHNLLQLTIYLSMTLVVVQSSEARRHVFNNRAVLSCDAEPPHRIRSTHLPATSRVHSCSCSSRAVLPSSTSGKVKVNSSLLFALFR